MMRKKLNKFRSAGEARKRLCYCGGCRLVTIMAVQTATRLPAFECEQPPPQHMCNLAHRSSDL